MSATQFSNLLNFVDPATASGAILWCSVSLFLLYNIIARHTFPQLFLASVSEFEEMLEPYARPKPQHYDLNAIGTMLGDGSFTNVVVLIGAGVSSSNTLDFRSEDTGLYAKILNDPDPVFDDLETPEQIFSKSFFTQNPEPFFTCVRKYFSTNFGQPTPTHRFLRHLEEKNTLLRVYTQNVDELETKAGVSPEKVSQVHGTFWTSTCMNPKCGAKEQGSRVIDEILEGSIPHCRRCWRDQSDPSTPTDVCTLSDILVTPKTSQPYSFKDAFQQFLSAFGFSTSKPKPKPLPPLTEFKHGKRDSIMKPDLVFFEEPVRIDLKQLNEDMRKCDLLIILGTSLTVAPFNTFPSLVPMTTPRLVVNRTAVNSLLSALETQETQTHPIFSISPVSSNLDDDDPSIPSLFDDSSSDENDQDHVSQLLNANNSIGEGIPTPLIGLFDKFHNFIKLSAAEGTINTPTITKKEESKRDVFVQMDCDEAIELLEQYARWQ
ncbi:putative NAD-dependent protein deacetylase hst1 [Blattamonas nauphoetae]|uniref:NAD-dependent protein deacetylase hst1 n=1 Tax=Blattamonas nauphoetae TaxID=2049346 RepID=A0ABQ9YLR0_9EUKA|nr:putative NAD-dependent protein deacetylase hst1 [Blattamonas nauphoetae]